MNLKNRIISASRRTDIPGLYLPWFKKRIREGFCVTVNPFKPSQMLTVSLHPEDVDCIVFWTRDLGPLLEDKTAFEKSLIFLEYLKEHYNFYFLVTITGYPKELESGFNLPPMEKTLKDFCHLAEVLSLKNWERRAGIGEFVSPVVWRFDPIIICDIVDFDYNAQIFNFIAGNLHGSCSRVIISVYDPYRKAEKRLASEGRRIVSVEGLLPDPRFISLLKYMKETADKNGMEIVSCCENLEDLGVIPGKCIDDRLIHCLFGIHAGGTKDPSQRDLCRCVESRDIGSYGTCVHGCKYCYATGSFESARKIYIEHYEKKYYEISPSISG